MKNSRVLFVFPTDNLATTMGEGQVFVEPSEPHSLLCLAAYVRDRGFGDVRILDAYAEGLSHDQIIQYIEEYNPDVVGFSCYTSDAPMTIQLSRRIKEKHPEISIVFGGSHPQHFAEEFLRRGGADFIVVGEGEETFYHLLTVLRDGGSFHNVNGIYFLDGDEVVKTADRERILDLDSLPEEAWDLAPMHLYRLAFWFHPK